MQMITFSSNTHQKQLTDEKRKQVRQIMLNKAMMIFSFGKCFDETMMRAYKAAIQ